MSEHIGYARCRLDKQDLTAQPEILLSPGVPEERIYPGHGLTGANRHRSGPAQALASVRAGDTLVVPKLDRLARSIPDARDIGDSLTARRQNHLVQQHQSGEHTIAGLAELFSVSRATVYRVLGRHRNAPAPLPPGGP
ncbi:recombinase family protein [Streptomyces sp. NPDC002403]